MNHEKQCVRAIIIRGDKLLTIERNKYGKHYFVLPGGHVDPGETLEEALQRELLEEASLPLLDWRMVFVDSTVKDVHGPQYVYLCTVDDSTEAVMSPDADEVQLNKIGENTYTLRWLAIDELPRKKLYTPALAQAVISGIKDGFPETPKTI